ncbi:MAG: DinB/UmuC family translesion DNA polymerase, partial [Luteimonas sp.]
VRTVGELRAEERELLRAHFGSFGERLYERARGIDERPVQPHQPVQSISSEDTFETDLPLEKLEEVIRALAEKTWTATRKTRRVGRTVVLKLKTDRFRILTRSHTPEIPPASAAELAAIALALRDRVDLPLHTRYRLAGVGLSGFREREEVPAQPALFQA